MNKSKRALAALMLTVTAILVFGCAKSEGPNNGSNNVGNNGGGDNGGGVYNGHEYVDFGLPSGTLWATCNVGATTSEGYGDFFAWGEIQTKEFWGWETYQYCVGDRLTKYCNNSSFGYNGFTDSLTTLLPEDDAATANWGDGWCMPTLDQWRELRDNTYSTWITQNGVEGRLITASGNSLFLPGICSDLIGFGGIYWSSSVCRDHPNSAWIFQFYSDHFDIGSCPRHWGMWVRPVRSTN